MYRSDVTSEESERTVFRKAEKKYKIYYDNTKKKKIARPVDLSEVIDFKAILEKYNCNGELVGGISVLDCEFDRPVFCLESRPGFYVIPGALNMEEQCQWIRESLTSFPQPPNRTNHNAIYGPIEDLFVAAKEGKVLVTVEKVLGDVCSEVNAIQSDLSTPQWKFVKELDESHGKDACKSAPASALLRKLRWSTLGLQFDWYKVLLESSFSTYICIYFTTKKKKKRKKKRKEYLHLHTSTGYAIQALTWTRITENNLKAWMVCLWL